MTVFVKAVTALEPPPFLAPWLRSPQCRSVCGLKYGVWKVPITSITNGVPTPWISGDLAGDRRDGGEQTVSGINTGYGNTASALWARRHQRGLGRFQVEDSGRC